MMPLRMEIMAIQRSWPGTPASGEERRGAARGQALFENLSGKIPNQELTETDIHHIRLIQKVWDMDQLGQT